MSEAFKEPRELQSIYEHRFNAANQAYRRRLWATLISDFFQTWVAPTATVLDLGCGYGEFINQVRCGRKFAMDLNPQAAEHLAPDVQLLAQDCSQPWALPDGSLDVVFTSNFFEHLPDKLALKRTILEASRCLRPGGRLIALGPNIKLVNGSYWDFWDHFLCLTDASLAAAIANKGFAVSEQIAAFLPYTTINAPRYPMVFVRLYLKLRLAWRFFGKQFLVIGEKPRTASPAERGWHWQINRGVENSGARAEAKSTS
jgi:SAM-dependent methyltransferase